MKVLTTTDDARMPPYTISSSLSRRGAKNCYIQNIVALGHVVSETEKKTIFSVFLSIVCLWELTVAMETTMLWRSGRASDSESRSPGFDPTCVTLLCP